MVFGAIVNWVVFRTLDFTTNVIWWATKTTVYGVYSAGHYMIVPVPKQPISEAFEMIPLMITDKEFDVIKEQNELLKKEVELLKTITTSLIHKNENEKENNQLSII
jgi:hypothetical protein